MSDPLDILASMLRRAPKYTDEQLAMAVAGSRNMREVLLHWGWLLVAVITKASGVGSKRSSWMSRSSSRRGTGCAPTPAAPLDELLVAGKLVQTSDLRRRLIQEGLKQARCEICGLDSWNGKPIPLDPVKGIRDDNTLVNLRIVCPNCHAQTASYRARNIGVAQAILE